jgi:hypothetical protein
MAGQWEEDALEALGDGQFYVSVESRVTYPRPTMLGYTGVN